ncbi:MAG: metallophosphoesterase, partial [Actinomycetota bacterium]
QKTWLQNALAASDAPWKVVVFHHPPYSTSSTHGSTAAMQWPFATWGADLVLTGHDHTWERIESGGITYAVNGLGGAGRYGFATTPVAGSVARYNANWGALRLTIDAATLTGEVLAVDGTLADRFALTTDGTTDRFQDGTSPVAYAGTRDATISQAAPTTAGTASFTMTATDASSGTASAPLTISVTAPSGPGAFAKSSPTDGTTGVRSPVTLKWGTATGATAYAVCIDADADSTCDSGGTSTGTARSLKRTLAAATTYRWQVRAVNAAGGTTSANAGAWWQFRTR